MKIFYILLLILFLPNFVLSQLLRSDDFKFKDDYWFWRADGTISNQSIPTVHDGMLHLKLLNAIYTEYCNTEIYDPSKPYTPGTQVRMRLKTTAQNTGSRGWGFWDGNLSELESDFDVAWVMEQGDDNTNPNYNWSHFGVDGNSLLNRETIDLYSIDKTQWHTYKIVWRSDSTFLFIDEVQQFVSTSNLPDENMRVDLWIDNRVININDPSDYSNKNSSGSEMFVDYVEISGINGPSIKRSFSGNTLLWDSPNTYASGKSSQLWKNYTFDIFGDGEALIFVTGDAESYGTISDDDDLKVVIDGSDYGWDNSNSLDGNTLNGSGASVVIPVSLTTGTHTLQLYSDITPFLKDVIVLHAPNGSVIVNEEYNQTEIGNDGLWKEINFTTLRENESTFLISGSGYENDKIRVEIDGIDYLWTGENYINGNELLGTPKTIVINEILAPGNHTIKIFIQGQPNLFNIVVYSVDVAFINTNVFLEGFYNNIGSNFSQSANFPKSQPYNINPWNYMGHEEVTTVPPNVTDWILIKLSNSAVNPTKGYKRAAFLDNNGAIVDLDGGPVKFTGIDSGNYLITVYHRNHLPILSKDFINIL